jgi:dethiobiotin synthetase
VSQRPGWVVVLAGTGTEVGKTWVAAALARRARAEGRRVAARKPAQSFDPDPAPSTTDAEVLAAATGEDPAAVCPPHRWYPAAMAPPMAADALDRPAISLAELTGELAWPAGCDLGLVETAGGLRSPLAHDADNLDLARALAPDLVLLVADAGLGTIHAVRSCLEVLDGLAHVVLLNRYDDGDGLHRHNRAWLAGRDGVTTEVDPAAIPLG